MNDLTLYQQHGQQHHAKAVHYSRYYTLEQLKQFYSTASFGFICASFASWCLMSFFIGQFFAGAEFEYMHEWRAIQYVYAAMGIALATAITVAEAVLFNSGRAREYMAVVVFAVGFSVFAESAATMQREQSTVAFKSTQSEVYKATIQAINVLSTTSTLTPAQVQLSRLQASYEQAKQMGNKNAMEALQGRILRVGQQAELEQANRSMALQNTIGQAKNLEYDETKHQAMIRFLAEVFGFSHVVSSALLAFFLVLTFKVCFHYLGLMRQLNERAISVNTGKLAVVVDQAPLPAFPTKTGKNGSVLGTHEEQLPLSLNTDGNRIAERVTRTLDDKNTDDPIVRDTDKTDDMAVLYHIAKSAAVGVVLACPTCTTTFTKNTYNQCFCGKGCKDSFWNLTKPERLQAARGANIGG